ncbi:MAG: 5-formyltetrahydrofolate cyclo-ligase [Eubacteriales bacterium]
MSKKLIRSKIKEEKKSLSLYEIESKSKIICNKFLRLRSYRDCNLLFAYLPFNQEIRIQEIINHAWNTGKKVAVPKIINKKMKFYYIKSWSDLEKGFYNILEPKTNELATTSKDSLMIMPGLAFDISMNRVGYGGGYYDKYLYENNKSIEKIALAYDFQLLDNIPSDSNDVKINSIITDKRMIHLFSR